jgi:hypothetical protein
MSARSLYLALCLVTGGFLNSSASGQMPAAGASARPVQLVVSGGLTLPSGDLKKLNDTGFHYDASLLLNIAGFPLTLRPEVSLTRLSLKEASGSTSGGYGSGDVTQLLGALGNIEVPIAGGLYVLAGGGLLSLKTPSTTASADLSQSKVTVNAGAGLRFHLGGISGFVEARMGTASYDNGKVGYSKAQFIPVSFGLVF